jgi:2-oxoglutarate dehydrogenase E1 component
MSDLRAFFGPNAGYVLELHDQYLTDPQSVDEATRQFFASFTPSEPTPDAAPSVASAAVMTATEVQKIAGAINLAYGIREYGHLAVALDPLGSSREGAPELEPETYGISEADLHTIPAEAIDGPLAVGAANAHEAIDRLRVAYTGAVGFDFDHIQVAAERS